MPAGAAIGRAWLLPSLDFLPPGVELPKACPPRCASPHGHGIGRAFVADKSTSRLLLPNESAARGRPPADSPAKNRRTTIIELYFGTKPAKPKQLAWVWLHSKIHSKRFRSTQATLNSASCISSISTPRPGPSGNLAPSTPKSNETFKRSAT